MKAIFDLAAQLDLPPTAQEHDIQKACVTLCTLSVNHVPELGLLFAIPNGGDRRASVGARLKREGVRAGVPDLFLPCPRGGYSGLFIEMKRPGMSPRPAQQAWINALRGQGYMVCVCKTVPDFAHVVLGYLSNNHIEE